MKKVLKNNNNKLYSLSQNVDNLKNNFKLFCLLFSSVVVAITTYFGFLIHELIELQNQNKLLLNLLLQQAITKEAESKTNIFSYIEDLVGWNTKNNLDNLSWINNDWIAYFAAFDVYDWIGFTVLISSCLIISVGGLYIIKDINWSTNLTLSTDGACVTDTVQNSIHLSSKIVLPSTINTKAGTWEQFCGKFIDIAEGRVITVPDFIEAVDIHGTLIRFENDGINKCARIMVKKACDLDKLEFLEIKDIGMVWDFFEHFPTLAEKFKMF